MDNCQYVAIDIKTSYVPFHRFLPNCTLTKAVEYLKSLIPIGISEISVYWWITQQMSQ